MPQLSHYALVNTSLLIGRYFQTGRAVIVRQGIIDAIIPENAIPATIPRFDLKGSFLAPGLIDLHTHGIDGMTLHSSEGKKSIAIDSMVKAYALTGTTSFLPTLFSSSIREMNHAFVTMESAMLRYPNALLGLHLEGPFLNPKRAGGHPKSALRAPNAWELAWLIENRALIKMVTLAPELFQPDELLMLANQIPILSIGHSDATYAQAMESFSLGVVAATHLFHCSSAMTARAAGVVGAVLESSDLYACVVLDKARADWPLFRMAYRLKKNHFILTSDLLPFQKALPHEALRIGDKTVRLSPQGVCYDESEGVFGSSGTLLDYVRIGARYLGANLSEALYMASTLPAKLLACETQLGLIATRRIANLIILSPSLELKGVVLQGEWLLGERAFRLIKGVQPTNLN